MQARQLGIFAAFIASLCCVGPLLLAALGLGGLGIAGFIGTNHWFFVGGAAALLIIAWYLYLREKKRCETEQCEMMGGKATRISLPLATLAVLTFFGLNLYTYAGGDISQSTDLLAVHAQTTIPVEGMTCYSCTVHIESSLKDMDGVYEVRASVPEKSVAISYDSAKVDVNILVAAINKTGYQAKTPEIQ